MKITIHKTLFPIIMHLIFFELRQFSFNACVKMVLLPHTFKNGSRKRYRSISSLNIINHCLMLILLCYLYVLSSSILLYFVFQLVIAFESAGLLYSHSYFHPCLINFFDYLHVICHFCCFINMSHIYSLSPINGYPG